MLEIAEPEAAVLFVHGDAVQAELAHRGPELVAREPVLGVDPRGQRRDPVGRRSARVVSRIISAVSPSAKSNSAMPLLSRTCRRPTTREGSKGKERGRALDPPA